MSVTPDDDMIDNQISIVLSLLVERRKKNRTSRSDIFHLFLVKIDRGGTSNQSDSLLIDVLSSKTPLKRKRPTNETQSVFEVEKEENHSNYNMLKSQFVPYSEKLRESVARRRANASQK